MSDSVEFASEIAALERFVVDNDDLLELESQIGRFNIFDALRVDRAEIRHSNFLAWLLDPSESHGQGALFLRAVLMDLMQAAPGSRPFSPIELDGEELRGVEIRREFKGIDLLITCKAPSFVIAIENKVGSGEHSNQLERYENTVRDLHPGVPSLFVFLTIDGEDASRETWVPYRYADVYRVLSRLKRTYANAIGDDVSAFLDHYLRLIGSRFMEDERIDELCRRIYQNHRQAIDLIVERVGPGVGQIISKIEQVVSNDPRWVLVQKSGLGVRFMPREWMDLLPPIGKEHTIGQTKWLTFVFRVSKNGCSSYLSVRPTTDTELRRKVIERITEDPEEFGLTTFFKNKSNMGSRYTNLGRQAVLNWKDDDEPDPDKLEKAVRRRLDEIVEHVRQVPQALRTLFARK
jgi:hypothetical protein